MPPKAVYIHIPFCLKRCYYCDFTTYISTKDEIIAAYLQALKQEIKLATLNSALPKIKTIYIGGGTPSVLNEQQLFQLFSSIYEYFSLDDLVEFTFEANPFKLSLEKLKFLKANGVNRISLGVQTFNLPLLKVIGREHGVFDIFKSIRFIEKAGFENFSIDLMFGLPTQTLNDVKKDLTTILKLNLQHISYYSLKLEQGTLFYKLFSKKLLLLPCEEVEYQMYQTIRFFLKDKGYSQYEISNFSYPGKESKHNLTYWLNEEYYGFGVGASGYLEGIRYENVKRIDEYLTSCKKHVLPTKKKYLVPLKEDMENYVILGLRLLNRGISVSKFQQRYNLKIEEVFGETISALQRKGLLCRVSDNIFLTEKGILFGNDVFAEFLS